MRKQCEVCNERSAYKHHEGYGFLCDYCASGIGLVLPTYTTFFRLDGHYYDPVVTK